jgi:hypothetical protein
MIKYTLLFLLALTAVTIVCCSSERKVNDKVDSPTLFILNTRYKENDLKTELLDTALHNIVNKTLLVKDENTAIRIVEPILLNIYGRKNIIRQRPYEVQKLDAYYIINGTLPEGSLGGVFLIVIDSRDARIVRLTHGK